MQGGEKKKGACMLCARLSLPQQGEERPQSARCTKLTVWLLSIFISSSIDKSCKDKYAWRLREVEGGRARTPGFSQRAHSVHCMLIKHSSAGWLSHVWQLRGEFLIYTSPHPGGCLVLVMAAVFTRCNWTTMFLTIQSWLFLVLRVTAGSKYIRLWLSPDISQQDLILT